jgi:membrane-associated protease RseP (regulator of RpoE activity)
MVSLSLALLNSLPLPRLDGAHMVEAVLDRLYPTTSKARLPVSPELAAGEMTEDQGEKGLVDAISNGTERLEPGAAIVSRRRNIERGIEFGVIGLTTLMLGGQVLVWVL